MVYLKSLISVVFDLSCNCVSYLILYIDVHLIYVGFVVFTEIEMDENAY